MEDRRRGGFTLSELLISLAVIALLAGIVVPAMTRHVDHARLRAATAALAEELRQARHHAINHRIAVYFSFAATKQDWCFGWSEQAAICADSDSAEDLHRRSAHDFPQVQLQSSRAAASGMLQFAPLRGTATAGSFHLRSRFAEARVIVSPLGRVRQCFVSGPGYPAC